MEALKDMGPLVWSLVLIFSFQTNIFLCFLLLRLAVSGKS